MTTYKIVRHFERGAKRTVKSGLTLQEAQAHCQRCDTSSRTATPSRSRRVAAGRGAWFDGYTEE
jgi:hypothetical protein